MGILNGSKYITLTPDNENKSEIKKKLENDDLGNYDDKYIKIRFNSNDNLNANLPLKQELGMNCAIKIARSVFYDDNKYYSQVFLDECIYNLAE